MTYIPCVFLRARRVCKFLHSAVALQLRLALNSRYHKVSDITSSLIEEMTHALSAEALADNVPLEAVLVDHVGHSRTLVSTSELAKFPFEGSKLTPIPHR